MWVTSLNVWIRSISLYTLFGLRPETKSVSDVCGLHVSVLVAGDFSLSVFFFFTQMSCSLARALNFANIIPSFKGIYYCSNLKAYFCWFYTGTCTEHSDCTVIYSKIVTHNLYSVHNFVTAYVQMRLFLICDCFIQKWTWINLFFLSRDSDCPPSPQLR